MTSLTGSWLARAAVLAVITLPAAAVRAQVVINEVEYDEPGTDASEYIELKNIGSGAVDLAPYSIQLINGASGGAAPYLTIPVTLNQQSVILAPGGYYVICDDATLVQNCNLDVSPDTNLIQNGAPDAMALLNNGVPVDKLSYEGNVPGFTEGTGAGADDGSSAGVGLARTVDGVDTGNNAADFSVQANTPGTANGGGAGPPVGTCADPATAIHVIQGTGSASAQVGQTVIIQGVVVGDFQDTAINGFFVQEEDGDADGDPATSEGIFVYEGPLNVPLGAGTVVRVRGSVSEFNSLTELTSVTDIVPCGSSAVASVQTLTFPVAAVANLERYEGMLVHIPQSLTVTGNFGLGRFGSLDLSVGGRLLQPTQVLAPGPTAVAQQDLNDRSRILLDDLSDVQDPDPIPYKDPSNTRRVGDTLPALDGVLDGRFNAYRIQPIGSISITSANPRPPAPDSVGGRLRVASFNVLNFFTTLDSPPGANNCGPSPQSCRGANTTAEFDRQRTKILNALETLGGDVVGLTELENNPSASIASLVDGRNARAVGPYAFVNTGVIGTDAIKVGIIYRSGKVTPAGNFAVLTSAVDPRFIDTRNRPALAQSFDEIATGARFTLVINHLKSKGSACADIGDPDHLDGQGNCNGTRTAAAAALLDWMASDPTHSGDPDFLLAGDLNAYAKEDPITTFKSGGFDSQAERFGGPGTYSYQFDGQSGSLDHALANAGMAAQVTGAIDWHINADEPVSLDYNQEFKTDDPFNLPDPFRASDHDPVVLGVTLVAAHAVPAVDGRGRTVMLMMLLLIGLALRRRQRPAR